MVHAFANKRRLLALTCAAGVLTLSACQSHSMREQSVRHAVDAQRGTDHLLKQRSVQPPSVAGQPDAAVIPGLDRAKTQTTNQYGASGYGMGTGTLSRIGSSGLRGDDPASRLEAELDSAGMADVHVLVADGTVFLAADGQQAGSDPLQRKLLSGTGGLSGKGAEPGPHGGIGIRSVQPDAQAQDTLAAAEAWLKRQGAGERIVAAAGPEAVDIVERLRSSSPASGSAGRAADLARLTHLAQGEGKNSK
ncbi:hypothetical protein [Cohnella sp. 56]|uniref:hypothetical protein n=1 Tax=Cohnella sp. 56 TaxID=3113722 RepID=UPI0030EAE715